MANDDKNINRFSGSDIEKYHKGQLSKAEMHAMEKAAMDDPFLADAMEGYSVAGINVGADIADLKNRLKEKTGSAKVVSLASRPRRSFQLIRVAVIIAFIAGAGILIYQLGFNNTKNNEIAQAKKEPAELKIMNDSTTPVGSATQPESSKTNTNAGLVSSDTKLGSDLSRAEVPKAVGNSNERSFDKPAEDITVESALVKPTDGAVTRSFEPAPPVSTGATGSGEKNKPSSREIADLKYKEKDKDVLKDNTFRGQITDERNVGVPFANVTNITENNAGTYADARGYFNLTYPDSVLNVQVKSIGFENRNAQLRNNVPTNKVILQDDRSSLSDVVVSKQKPNAAARNRDSNLKLEEPEPADGWEKYDAYLLNNLNMPDDAKEQQKSDAAVLLSFEVNKNGQPTNIKVEKSLCKDCDKEAIRLIKEGPKWKRSAKKGRISVTVPFNQN